jgi:hypothetical protein
MGKREAPMGEEMLGRVFFLNNAWVIILKA